jgi:ATP-dependent HslUV protease ATP-binding subunit HslU
MFPVRVELKSLSKDDFIQILLKPKNALTKQYTELLKSDNVELEFTEDGIEAIAEAAFEMNLQNEDIGARRLHTVIEQVLMDASFEAPSAEMDKVIIDSDYVHSKTEGVFNARDTRKYII